MGAIASQITSLTIVYSIVCSDADQRKHQSSASLAFVRGIHRGPVNSPHKWPVRRKMFPFDDVIMCRYLHPLCHHLWCNMKQNHKVYMNLTCSKLRPWTYSCTFYMCHKTSLLSWNSLVIFTFLKDHLPKGPPPKKTTSQKGQHEDHFSKRTDKLKPIFCQKRLSSNFISKMWAIC